MMTAIRVAIRSGNARAANCSQDMAYSRVTFGANR
jgi:hypothetical protein